MGDRPQEKTQSIILVYHPSCQACRRLIEKIPDSCKDIQLLNIMTLPEIPAQITKVPCLVIDKSQFITGKEAFDKCEQIISGPSCYNVYGGSSGGFLDNNQNFSSNNFTSFGEGCGSHGFENVPKFEELEKTASKSTEYSPSV